MFRQPEKKLSISGRVKRAAQASGEDRSRVSSFVPLAHVLFTIDSLCLSYPDVSIARAKEGGKERTGVSLAAHNQSLASNNNNN